MTITISSTAHRAARRAPGEARAGDHEAGRDGGGQRRAREHVRRPRACVAAAVGLPDVEGAEQHERDEERDRRLERAADAERAERQRDRRDAEHERHADAHELAARLLGQLALRDDPRAERRRADVDEDLQDGVQRLGARAPCRTSRATSRGCRPPARSAASCARGRWRRRRSPPSASPTCAHPPVASAAHERPRRASAEWHADSPSFAPMPAYTAMSSSASSPPRWRR